MNHRMLLSTLTATRLLLLFLISVEAVAASEQTARTALVDADIEVTVSTEKGVRAYASHPLIPVTLSGLWYISPGSYVIRREAHVGGRRYALIPWARRQPNEDRILDKKKDKNGCESTVQHFAAIDIETKELQKETWTYSNSECDIGDRWGKRLWLAPDYTHHEFEVTEELASAAVARRRESAQVAQEVARRTLESEQERKQQQDALAQREAPAKRTVGSTVCIVRRGMGYAGYTEQVNEDTGRIRIRIVRHFNPENGRFLQRIPQEENVWENPDSWYLCEF